MDQVNFFQNFVSSFGLNLNSHVNYGYNNQYYNPIAEGSNSYLNLPMRSSYESAYSSISSSTMQLNDESSVQNATSTTKSLPSSKPLNISKSSSSKANKPSKLSPEELQHLYKQPALQIENKRVRNMFNEKQIEILERAFEQTHYPDLGMREELSKLLNLKPLRIQVWFQNRRAKYRKFDFSRKSDKN